MPDSERVNNPINLNLIPRGIGNTPVIIQVSSDDDNLKRLRVLLEDAGDRNTAVLLYHQADVDAYYDRITEMGFKCTKHHHRSPAGLEIENILVTTYKSAKGLEFQVVIMPDMQTAMDDIDKTPEHYYIACTRAKESLYLMFTGGKLPGYIEQFDKKSYEFVNDKVVSKNKVRSRVLADDLPF